MTITRITPTEAGVAVGDFFVASWGYDQTNIDFFKVVGLTAKGVKVQPWTSAMVDDDPDGRRTQDAVVPGEGPARVTDWSACTPDMDYWERQEAKVVYDAPVEQKFLTMFGDTPWFHVNSIASAKKWDGRPEYQTASGWGH